MTDKQIIKMLNSIKEKSPAVYATLIKTIKAIEAEHPPKPPVHPTESL